MGDLAHRVGLRIRSFRRMRGLSVEQLAARIEKSKATVYKYESGQIPVDVDTLSDISAALQMDASFFFDQPVLKRSGRPGISFFDSNRLYAYYYDGRIKRVVRSLLAFRPGPEGEIDHASFYMNLTDFEKPETSRYIYSGNFSSHETVSYFIFENLTLPIETLVIELLHPFRTSLISWGVFLGMSDSPMTPMATKILVSKAPLTDEELASYPLRFTKEELKDIREKNALLLALHR